MIEQHGTLEISSSRLAHNLRVMQERIGPNIRLCATIKANAYGHGVEEIATLLRGAGVDWACVYSLDEARDLEGRGFAVLVLAPFVLAPGMELSRELIARLGRQIRVNITDEASARGLSAAVVEAGRKEPVKVHVQVDAGLTRAGAEPREAQRLATTIGELPGLELEGLFAHFSHGDVPGHETVQQQLTVLAKVAAPLRARHPGLIVHLQNSGGAWHLGKDSGLDMARVGIALYGMQASTLDPIPELRPIARLIAPILAIHQREAGTGVGYGHTFVTRRLSRLAIVPVGYADGYPRMLSNRCVAQVRGVDVPVVGRVSMDQIILDITDVSHGPVIGVGEKVTVVSWEPGRPNSLDEMADTVGTIGYELATHLGAGGGGRLKRVVVD